MYGDQILIRKDDPARDSYHCVFLAKQPNNTSKSDELSRFWLEWHRYTRCFTQNDIVYGDRILIRPSYYPDKEKIIQLYYNLLLLDSSPDSHSIIRPFDFEKIDAFNRTRQKVYIDNWKLLYTACIKLGIAPPTFRINSFYRPTAYLLSHRKRKFQVFTS